MAAGDELERERAGAPVDVALEPPGHRGHVDADRAALTIRAAVGGRAIPDGTGAPPLSWCTEGHR